MAASSALYNVPLQLQCSRARCSSFPFSGQSILIPPGPLLRCLRLSSSRPNKPARPRIVVAAQQNFFRVLQTVWKVGKDGIEAGANLIPDPVPRTIARIGVAVAMVAVSLLMLKYFLSMAVFALSVMGLVYFVYIAWNRDDGPKGGRGAGMSQEETLEEARRIMEKYK